MSGRDARAVAGRERSRGWDPRGRRLDSARCLVVVGCQWGDEGKGKIVDVLAQEMDVVARFQGGANAGHTVHVGDDEFILHQIPSGILHSSKRCLIGNGVVLDLFQFFEELDGLVERGVDVTGRLGVSERTHLVLPYHRMLDRAAEDRTEERIGTTGRGIGPAYEDKVGRRGVRVADSRDPHRFRELLERGVERARRRLRELGSDPALEGELDGMVEDAMALRERLREVACDAGEELARRVGSGGRALLEGAQGTALDLDQGTYPFVTSSNTTAGAAALGAGVGPTMIDGVLGVVKAYTTRVGNGPLPSEFDLETSERMRTLGGEFGATTGRPRRVGWFDAVIARHAARVNGLTGLAVTKLDVLDTLPEVGIATGYRTPEGVVDEFPADTHTLDEVEPVVENHPGWQSPTSEARSLQDLPREARAYLDRLEEITGAPIEMVSVGTRRNQVIRVG